MGELGSWLVRAREDRGLTLEDAERDTRISRRYLQALETEHFEVIPAPVYARGFLRSYSQYLGLDPKEILALFPREDQYPGQRDDQRPSRENPIPAQSASRPTWRREEPPPPPRRPEPREQAPPPRRQEPARQQPPRQERAAERPRGPQPPRRGRDEYDYDDNGRFEPMIGVDIGVPAPARRIQTDPAASTRTAVVAIVAIGAILGIVLLALMISRSGGDDGAGELGTGGDGAAAATGSQTATAAATQTTEAAGGIEVTPGVVPAVEGHDIIVARDAIERAGFTVNEIRASNAAPVGEVFQQAPPAGTPYQAGEPVTIAVSDGP